MPEKTKEMKKQKPGPMGQQKKDKALLGLAKKIAGKKPKRPKPVKRS